MDDLNLTGPITFPGKTRAVETGSNDKLMELVLAKARNPERFEKEGIEPYFFSAEISNERIDSYFTTMDISSLENYARDSSEGVAFMSSHDVRKLPLGQSLQGTLVAGRGAEPTHVVSDFYTVPGMNINGVNTDEFMRGIDFGLVRDVSIGFNGGEFICSICGRDMMDWSVGWDEMCMHIPGVQYPVYDKAGNATDERVLCTANITNAGLSEVSAVYDGATPGASIRQAIHVADAGKLTPAMARNIESWYGNRFKIPGATRVWAPGEIASQEGQDMTGKRDTKTPTAIAEAVADTEVREADAAETTEVETPVAQVAETAETTEVAATVETPTNESESVEATQTAEDETPDADAATTTENPESDVRSQEAATAEDAPANTEVVAAGEPQGDADEMKLGDDIRAIVKDAVGDIEDPLEGARKMASELERLRPLADMGRQYREDLIQETLEEGVRAFGNSFPVETKRSTFNKLDVEEIKAFRTEYSTKAGEALAPGRQTHETDQAPEAPTDEVKRSQNGQKVETAEISRKTIPASSYNNV